MRYFKIPLCRKFVWNDKKTKRLLTDNERNKKTEICAKDFKYLKRIKKRN